MPILKSAATARTESLCPIKVLSHLPVSRSQIFSDKSVEPEIALPKLKSADTAQTSSLCPIKVFSHSSVMRFQTFSELSVEQEIALRKLKSAATALTQLVCPTKGESLAPGINRADMKKWVYLSMGWSDPATSNPPDAQLEAP